MVPMAIPIFGGMLIELLTMLVVPFLFCLTKEIRNGARQFQVKIQLRHGGFWSHCIVTES